MKDNPSIHVKTPKVEKKIPTFIQENKINELMNMPDRTTMVGKRDHAMLELFYATGIRLSELVGLNIGSVSHNENILKVFCFPIFKNFSFSLKPAVYHVSNFQTIS